MKNLIYLLIFSMTTVSFYLPANAFADFLSDETTGTTSSDTTYKLVTSTGVMVADAKITVIGDMIIKSGGVVTHSPRLLEGIRLKVDGTLDVQTGGMIDVNEKGLKGGDNGSLFGGNGETYDTNGSIISAGNGAPGIGSGGGGASFGGWGGNGDSVNSNSPYGLIENPEQLGSGGGYGNMGANGLGGNGGGRVTIAADSCFVNGIIRANGGYGGNGDGGGGSGGAIKMAIGSLGGTGTIQALGGNANYQSGTAGSGSGGRIAILNDSINFPAGNINAYGGNISSTGAAGTIFLKNNGENYGDLIIDNGNVVSNVTTPLMSSLNTFRSIKLNNRGNLKVLSSDITSFTVEQPSNLTNNSVMTLDSNVTMTVSNATGFDINVQSGSELTLDSASVLNADALRFNSGTLNTSINLSFPIGSHLELSGGGRINILDSTIFSIGIFEPLNIQSGTVNLTSGARLDIATNSAIIGPGVTLIKDGDFGVNDSIDALTIQSGGVATHSSRLLDGLQLNVIGTIDVQSGGLIDVNGKGLLGGRNGSAFGSNGEAFNGTNLIVSGAESGKYDDYEFGAGGSYGGWGGIGSSSGPPGAQPNPPYGSLETPVQLGSGGGAWTTFPPIGGNGGGRVTLTAGTCIIDGTIRANGIGHGDVPGYVSAGGSGGSILMNVDSLSGAGLIESKGGSAYVVGDLAGGAGSGGRIAIYLNENTFPIENISVDPGSTGNAGSVGTIYLQKSLLITVFLEGLYNSVTGQMNKASNESGPMWGNNIADKITIELHSSDNYSTIVYTASNVNLSTSGKALVTIPRIDSGSYFITIRHRNSIETTTAAPVSFTGGNISYDFSTAASKAYGNNLLNKDGSGVFVIYAGDVNQDRIIDLSDMLIVDSGIESFATGYLNADVNGDGLIGLSDMLMIEANSDNFVSSVLP